MTRNGLAFAAMVVTSAIVGWLLDWQEFRIIAIGGALLLLLSAAFFWGPLDMKCRRHVEPGLRTTVGEPTFGVVKFDRKGSGSRFGLAFEDQFDGDALVAIPPRIEAGAETRYELPTNRRGVFPRALRSSTRRPLRVLPAVEGLRRVALASGTTTDSRHHLASPSSRTWSRRRNERNVSPRWRCLPRRSAIRVWRRPSIGPLAVNRSDWRTDGPSEPRQ